MKCDCEILCSKHKFAFCEADTCSCPHDPTHQRRSVTKLSHVHSCEKSEGKMIIISMDHVGGTFCGYCNQRVDYSSWMRQCMKEFRRFGNEV